MFASRIVRNRAAWCSCPLAASLASLAAVMFFIGLLGIVFLPPEIGRIINSQYVSVTHCLDMGVGRPMVTLFWAIGREGILGWQHHVAIQSTHPSSPNSALDFSDRKPLSLAKGPAVDQALVGNWDGSIYSLDLRHDRVEPVLLGQHDDGGVVALASSNDGRWVISQGALHIHAWDVQAQSERWRRDDAAPYCFAVRPDSTAAIIGNHRGDLIEIDLASGHTLRTLAWGTKPLLTIGLSPDGNKLALLRLDGELLLVNSHDGLPLWDSRSRRCQTAAGRIVSFSPCGTLLVTAGHEDGKSLALWSVANGDPLRQLDGHKNIVIGAAFTDSGLLRSWGADGTIRAWDLATGRTTNVATLSPPADFL